jgi:hypothetical protein
LATESSTNAARKQVLSFLSGISLERRRGLLKLEQLLFHRTYNGHFQTFTHVYGLGFSVNFHQFAVESFVDRKV